MHWVKYLPAIVLLIIAVLLAIGAQAGDNTDARALAGILDIPALVCAVLAALAGILAYLI